jgi:hypothetical protein
MRQKKSRRAWPNVVGWGFLTGAAMVSAWQLGGQAWERYANNKSPYVQQSYVMSVPKEVPMPQIPKIKVKDRPVAHAATAHIHAADTPVDLEKLVKDDILQASKRVADWHSLNYYFQKGTPMNASTYLVSLKRQIKDVEKITRFYGGLWGAKEQEICTILAKLYHESGLDNHSVS